MVKEKKIYIAGAFDRYNYGDVLLPIILEKRLRAVGFDDIEFCSTKEADLSYCGGFKTIPLSSIYNKSKDSTIILTGGDVIGASIGTMFLHLSENKGKTFILKVFRKILGNNIFNYLCSKYTKLDIFPWVIDKEKFHCRSVIYNAVGATNAQGLDSKSLKLIEHLMQKADYTSFRESYSQSLIKNIDSSVYPDSAISMSEYFSRQQLKQLSTEKINNFINKYKNQYICIQVNREYLKDKNLDEICKELARVISQGYKILLLPIGFAALHEDLHSLDLIYKSMESKDVFLFDEISIFEIMNLIANSYFFAGTSLHGNITAMSYAVKHFCISRKMTKVIEFLNEWDIPEQQGYYELSNLSDCVEKVKDIKEEDLLSNLEVLLKYSDDNFSNIVSAISKGE